MNRYTLDEARKIVLNCSKIYEKKLLNKKFEIIYRDRNDNEIKDIELYFGKENYQHLTGIELLDNNGKVREHVAELFYDKCVKNRLAKKEIQFKKDGTTNLKLVSLPILMEIYKVTKITGDYNGIKPYLIADKVVGNVNFCLGLKKDERKGYYVPASSLLHNIKDLTLNQSQVLAILSKDKNEILYGKVRHVAKGINLTNLNLPQSIKKKISLDQYIFKSKKQKD